MHKYKSNTYSQNGEDGILAEVFERLKIEKGSCCEFGAADGKYCSNTFALIEKGWKGKMIEPNTANMKALIDNTIQYGVEIYCGKVTPENVNRLVPQTLDLLSIDIDNDDYHVWKAYTGNAKVVVIEINSGIAPPEEVIPGNRGSSYSAMALLGIDKGYFPLVHTGNLIFVRNEFTDLFPDADDTFDPSWL